MENLFIRIVGFKLYFFAMLLCLQVLGGTQAAAQEDPLIFGEELLVTIQSGQGPPKCLIFGSNGTDRSPTRFNWGKNNWTCGLADEDEILRNHQAVWRIIKLGSNYVLKAAPLGGAERCLIFGGNGDEVNPTLFDWGLDNIYCGLPDYPSLSQSKQAVWDLVPLGNDQYLIMNASNGTNLCLAFDSDDLNEKPKRVSLGTNGPYCGLPDANAVLANGKGVFQMRKLIQLTRLPVMYDPNVPAVQSAFTYRPMPFTGVLGQEWMYAKPVQLPTGKMYVYNSPTKLFIGLDLTDEVQGAITNFVDFFVDTDNNGVAQWAATESGGTDFRRDLYFHAESQGLLTATNFYPQRYLRYCDNPARGNPVAKSRVRTSFGPSIGSRDNHRQWQFEFDLTELGMTPNTWGGNFVLGPVFRFSLGLANQYYNTIFPLPARCSDFRQNFAVYMWFY